MNWLHRMIVALRRTTPEKYPGSARIVYVPMQSQAGIRVDHDNALQLSAVWACVRIISETIAALPWQVFQYSENSGRERVSGAFEAMLDIKANGEMDAGTLRETLLGHALTWGNGYAEIERDGFSGRPVALWPIMPDRVAVKRDDDGQLVYEISQSQGKTLLPARDVFHLHGLGFDGLQGYSVISMAAQSIGLGLATERYGSAFFGNGAIPGLVLQHPAALSAVAYDRIKESWQERHQGPNKAHRPAILEEGMSVEKIGLPPEDSQFLETRKFQTQEICRWYRVPPHKVADLERATFSNIEHQAIEFVQDTILPWTRRLEREAQIKLLGPTQRNRQFTRLNLKSLLRGDDKSRAEFYDKMRNMGVFSVNEIRALEDMNPIGPAGDKHIVQMNMTTLEKVGEEPEPPAPQVTEEPAIDADDAENRKKLWLMNTN